MAKINMIDFPSSSMDRAIASKSGKLEAMTAPQGMSFRVDIEVDSKIEKVIAKDPLLNAKMKDAVKAVYDDLVDRIGTNLAATDKGAVTLRDKNDTDKLKKLIEVVNKNIVGARDVAIEQAEKAALKVWAEVGKQKSEYTKYKIKIITKMTLGVAGLAVSIGLLAGGVVSFGASSIPGIIGMVKSVAVLASQAKSAHEEIETAQQRLDKHLRSIEKSFVNAKGEFTKRGKAQEAGVAIAAQLFGTTGPFAIVPSIKECSDALGVIKSKLNGLQVNTHEAAKHLNKILENLDAAKKKFMGDVEKKLSKHPAGKNDIKLIRQRLDKQLEPFEGKVQAALEAVITLQNRHKTAEPKVKHAEARVAQLVKLKGVGWKIFDNVLVFTDVAVSFTDPGQYAKLTETLGGLVPGAASLVADKITKAVFDGTVLE